MPFITQYKPDPRFYQTIYRSDGTLVAENMYILTYHSYFDIPSNISSEVAQRAFELQLAWSDFVDQYPEELI